MSRINSRAVKAVAAAGFDIWDIFSEESELSLFTFEDGKTDKQMHGIDSGCAVRDTTAGKTSYFASSGAGSLGSLVQQLPKGSERQITLTDLKSAVVNPVRTDPVAASAEEKIRLLRLADDTARSAGKEIRQVTITCAGRRQAVEIVNDTGARACDTRYYSVFNISVVAEKEGRIETGRAVIAAHAGMEAFPEELIKEKAAAAAAQALRLLDAKKKISGEMTAVISSEAGGTFIHEAVGHSLEADLVQKGLSTYQGKTGTKVASDVISVLDDTTLIGKRGSYAFDDEGTPAQKTVLIENGILRSFINDRETAAKDKVAPTGNGRRESYRFRPIPRMTNTMIAPRQDGGTAEALIKDTKNGIFVRKMGGGQVNTVTGEFIFEVKEGYLIENGVITTPLRDATLMGTGQEVLNTIDAVCSDIGFDVGTCGKDGQGAPVSDAQPTIRVPKILVGSK